MGDSWKEIKISELGRIVTGKTPPTADPENYGGILPFITPSDMKGQKYIDRTERSISAKGCSHVRNLVIPSKTVFVSCIGSDMGKVGMTTVESVTNQQINSIIVRDGIDADYVYYNLYSRKEELQRLATSGSAQPILNKGHFSQLKINLPPLPEQKAIASILGALDDKIELNRKMNETLEDMARAIFKSSFTYPFEGLKYLQGEAPSSEAPSPALRHPFPLGEGRGEGELELVDSPLGKIPKEWRAGTVGELGEIICGKTPSTRDSDNYGSEIPFITIPDMHGRVFVTNTNVKLSNKGADTQKKKCLPTMSVCVSCIATPGLVALTSKPSHTNQQINSIICKNDISPFYCFFLLKSIREDIINAGSGGSATLNLNKGNFSKMKILIASKKYIEIFHKTTNSIFTKLLFNDIQSENLASIRDALLPKLLSGEIRVKNAERFMEGRA
jgi:type I restriction enzyme S subunit